MRRRNWWGKWAAAVDAAEMPGFRFHDLRHTCNTLTAATGASTRELMHRMGHSSAAAALRYRHATRGPRRGDRPGAPSDHRGRKAMKQRHRRGEPRHPKRRSSFGRSCLIRICCSRTTRDNFRAYGFFGVSVLAETPVLRLAGDHRPPVPEGRLGRAVLCRRPLLIRAGTLDGTAPHYDVVPRGSRRPGASYHRHGAPRRRQPEVVGGVSMTSPRIDLWADLNAEDDEGRNWSMVRVAGHKPLYSSRVLC